MPVGKEIGTYDAKFTSVRTVDIHGDERVIEGSYMGRLTGQLSGTVSGTMTFSGTTERGTIADKGVGYLDSGDVISGKGQGVYWAGGNGKWEIRAAFSVTDQMIVSEGQVTLANAEFTMEGKMFELT